jgi:DNA adenine methylase
MRQYSSPLRYPGGKAVLSGLLGEILKASNLQRGAYAEPFAGGAGAALDLLFREQVWDIFINDADWHIFSFWKSILEESDRFRSRIASIPITIEEWKRQHSIFCDPENNSLFNVGFAAFFLNRTNRSGILDGRPIGGLAQAGKWKIDARFNRSGLIQRIDRIRLFKNRIHVFNLEAVRFLDEVIAPLKGNVLVYLDPPYYKMGSELYLNFYRARDHQRLRSYLQSEITHPWVLSYDDVHEIRSLYEGVPCENLSLNYSANVSKKGKEVLFFSKGLQKPCMDFRQISLLQRDGESVATPTSQ